MEQIQICLCNFRAKLEINLDILVFFSTHGCLQFQWNRMYFCGAILRLRDQPLIVLCHGFYSLIKSWWHTSRRLFFCFFYYAQKTYSYGLKIPRNIEINYLFHLWVDYDVLDRFYTSTFEYKHLMFKLS